MWELDYKKKLSTKELMLLNCGVGEDSWESLSKDCKEIQPIYPKGDQSWVFFGRTDAEAETPILLPPDEEVILLERPWCWVLGLDGITDSMGMSLGKLR